MEGWISFQKWKDEPKVVNYRDLILSSGTMINCVWLLSSFFLTRTYRSFAA